MREALIGWLALAIVTCGCGGTSGEGSTTSDTQMGSGGAGGATATSCSPEGARLVLRGAVEAVSTNAEAGADGAGRGVVAIIGDDGDGNVVYWRRAGDVGDAAISETGTFDVSQYPNNIQVLRMAGADGVIMDGFYAMAGTLTVTEVGATLRATFHLEALRDSADVESGPGAPIDGVVDGCVAAPVVAESTSR